MTPFEQQLRDRLDKGHKRIYRFDASSLKNSSCGLRFKRDVIDGYKDKVKYNDTFYGTALHKFMSMMAETGGNFNESVIACSNIFAKANKIRPKKEHLNKTHLLKTCFDYWEYIGKNENHIDLVINPEARCWKCNGIGLLGHEETGGICSICNGKGKCEQPMVEITFDIPLLKNELFDINIAGTIDRLCKIKNGCFAIRDYKTSSSWDPIKYLNSYKNSTQLLVYLWSINEMARRNPGSFLDEVTRYPMGAFIDGVFLKSKTETIFISSEMHMFKPEKLEMFNTMLYLKAQEIESYIVSCINGDADPFPNGMIENLCGGFLPCKYVNVCSAVDEVAGQYVLKNTFEQSEYNPLTFAEED